MTTIDDTPDELAQRTQALTAEVVASFDGAPPRVREVLQSLVRHLHGFAREVRLTEPEWQQAKAPMSSGRDCGVEVRSGENAPIGNRQVADGAL